MMRALLMVAALAAAGGFERSDIAVSTARVPGSPFAEFRFVLDGTGDLETLCARAFGTSGIDPGEPVTLRVVLRESTDERVSYEQISPPVVSRRDYVVRRTRSHPAPGSCRIDFVSVDGEPPRRGLVRLRRLAGSFVFEQQPGGRVRIDHRIHLDPGGSVPSWMVEPSIRSMGVETVTRVLGNR